MIAPGRKPKGRPTGSRNEILWVLLGAVLSKVLGVNLDLSNLL
jgi:hypothetical protein